jgi:hypothetical protein
MAPGPAAVVKRAAAAALVAMWICQEAALLTGWEGAAFAGVAAFSLYFLVALTGARSSQRGVIAAVSCVAIGITLHYHVSHAFLSGIESAVLFAAFLATMQMLRVALEASPLVGAMRTQFAGLSTAQQHDSTLLRAHLLSSVLGAGGLAVMAPLLAPDEPREVRRAFAQSALQGMSLSVLWSPFFVAMAVCTRFVRDVGLGAAILEGVGMALLGLGLSHFLHGARSGPSPLSTLRRTLAEVAVLAAAIILANRIWGLSSLEAVVLGIPPVALWTARRQVADGPSKLARLWFVSLESIAVEALVVGAALVLGEVFNELLVRGIVSIPHGADAWPILALISLPPLLMLGSSLLGLHPIVSASCLLPLLTSSAKLHASVVIGSVLLGWMLCVALSSFVVPVMYAATVFGVSQRELVLGRNLRFCAFFAPLAVLYLWALNTLLPMAS